MRQKLKKITDNRTYKIVQKNLLFSICWICKKRTGSWHYSCPPHNPKFRHGNGKGIFKQKYREFKTWKYNRKTKWK